MAIINGHMRLCSAPITTPWRFIFARQGWPQERLGLSIYCLSHLLQTFKPISSWYRHTSVAPVTPANS